MNDTASSTEESQQPSHSPPARTYGQHPLPATRKGTLYLPRLQVEVAYESLVEMNFLYVADADPRVVSVRRADSIRYPDHNGTWHTYTPDFHIVVRLPQGDLHAWICECKPRDLLRDIIGNELLEWQIRQKILARDGSPLRMVTDHDLSGPRLEHALKFGGFFHSVPLPDLRTLVLKELSDSRLALGELFSRLETRVPTSFQTVTWRLQLVDTVFAMIASGTLHADRTVLPDDACPVWRAEHSGPTELPSVGVPVNTYIAKFMGGWPAEPAGEETELRPDPDHHLTRVQFLATARGEKYLKLFSLYNDPAVPLEADLLERLGQETGLSRRSLFRYRNLLLTVGSGATFDQLIPELTMGRHAPTNTVDPEVAEIIELQLQERYLTRVGTTGRHVTGSDLHDAVMKVCLTRDLPVPAKTTVNRAIGLAYYKDPFAFTLRRSGREEASKLEGRQGRDRATRYGERLAMDHTLCDVFIVKGKYLLKEVKRIKKDPAKPTRKARKKNTLRATLIVITDDATGEVVFSDVMEESASAGTSLDALRRVMLGDRSVPLAAGVQAHPAFTGVPAQVRLDGGGEFDNRAVKRALQGLGITLIPRNKGNKHNGGREERTIGTVIRTQHMLPGTTMHNIAARGEYDAQAGATLDMELLSRFLQRVVEQYNMQPAPGLGLSRSDHALALIQTGQVSLRQPSPHQRRYLNDRMLPFEDRVCGRQGIEVFGLHYVSQSYEMELLIRRRAKVQVIYHPDDLRTISLVHPEDGKLLTLNVVPDFNIRLDVRLAKKDWDRARKAINVQREQLHEKRLSPQQILDGLRIESRQTRKKVTPGVPEPRNLPDQESPAAEQPVKAARRITPTSLLTPSSPPTLKA